MVVAASAGLIGIFDLDGLSSMPYNPVSGPPFHLNAQSLSTRTYRSLPLPQHRIRRPRPQRRIRPILLHLRMARSMIHPTLDPDRIPPHEILRRVIPRGLKFLLADGARGTAQSGITGHGDGFVLGVILGSFRCCLGLCALQAVCGFGVIVDVFSRFDPILGVFV